MTQIKGQITISEYLTPKDVEIKGICDDAYCPECNYCFDELKEKDCEFCPYCHTRVSWARWHRVNDGI